MNENIQTRAYNLTGKYQENFPKIAHTSQRLRHVEADFEVTSEVRSKPFGVWNLIRLAVAGF
jgi:hypothetical protein